MPLRQLLHLVEKVDVAVGAALRQPDETPTSPKHFQEPPARRRPAGAPLPPRALPTASVDAVHSARLHAVAAARNDSREKRGPAVRRR